MSYDQLLSAARAEPGLSAPLEVLAFSALEVANLTYCRALDAALDSMLDDAALGDCED